MFETILRIIALTRKELLAMLKDPRGRASILIPPIIQCVVFAYTATYDLNDVPYAVLDHDRSAASGELLAGLSGSTVFRRVAELNRVDDIKTQIDERHVLIAIQIDRGFERQLFMGQPAGVQVIADGRNSNTAAIAMGYVGAVVESFNAKWRAAHGLTGPPVQVTTRAWYNYNLETRWHMLPSLVGTLTMVQALLLTALSVAREREQGTFDQLLVTPLRPFEIMAGKAVPSVLIGMLQGTGILLVAQLWFRIPFAGSLVTLYAGLSLFLLAAVGIGLFISSLVSTMQQAVLFNFIVVMPFTLLSGLATPINSIPRLLRLVTVINPLRYAIDIAQGVYLEGAGFDRLGPEFWPLIVIAVVTLSATAWMFRHRMA
jgi:ABC-2 type transport system permease protein